MSSSEAHTPRKRSFADLPMRAAQEGSQFLQCHNSRHRNRTNQLVTATSSWLPGLLLATAGGKKCWLRPSQKLLCSTQQGLWIQCDPWPDKKPKQPSLLQVKFVKVCLCCYFSHYRSKSCKSMAPDSLDSATKQDWTADIIMFLLWLCHVSPSAELHPCIHNQCKPNFAVYNHIYICMSVCMYVDIYIYACVYIYTYMYIMYSFCVYCIL